MTSFSFLEFVEISNIHNEQRNKLYYRDSRDVGITVYVMINEIGYVYYYPSLFYVKIITSGRIT